MRHPSTTKAVIAPAKLIDGLSGLGARLVDSLERICRYPGEANMHLARFLWRDRVCWGVIDGEDVREIRGDLHGGPRPGPCLGPLAEARLLAPLEPTNKVIGIAANYGEKDDRDGPGIFM